MNEINDEIKLTLNLMQADIDDDAHSELQYHLAGLLEMKRNELQQRLVERSWLEPVTHDLKKAFGCYARPSTTEEPYKNVDTDTDHWCCYLSGIDLSGFVFDKDTKPLTAEELKAGGWWCADVSAECEMAFKIRGLDVSCAGWSGIGNRNGDCCILGYPKFVSRAWIKSHVSGEKQIHRIGNEFYWSEK